jgi:hypothetical protein
LPARFFRKPEQSHHGCDRRRYLFDLRPRVKIRFRHCFAIGRRIHDRRRDRIDQNAVLGDLLGKRHGQGGDASFRCRVGGHARTGPPFQCRASCDIDNAPTLTGCQHRLNGRAATDEARDEVIIDLRHQSLLIGLCYFSCSKAAG